MNKTTLLTLLALSSPLPAQEPQKGAPPAVADVFMQQLDMNKDGMVSKAEFVKPQEAQFAQIDTNKDGSIDKTEVDTFDAKMRQRMQQLQQKQSAK